MATSSLGGAISNFCSNPSKFRCSRLETLDGARRAWIRHKPVEFASLIQLRRCLSPVIVTCGATSETADNSKDSLEEKRPLQMVHSIPNSQEVESLLTEICDTKTIAEFELKLGNFRLYVMRNLNGKSEPPLPPSASPVNMETSTEPHGSNGSVATTSLTISKPQHSEFGIHRLLETAADEGLVVIQSPKVGFFRRSRTIKGKRASPPCKEKQAVKEGQVLCYIEQLGGEIPIESDVSGEVIRILREDGEPVGYGDALIAILPSFPGMKKLQ